MPGLGLDSSSWFATNEAVGQGLVFGRDIVFVFGPYGGIRNLQYHPATDGLILATSTLLAVAFVAGVMTLALASSRRYWALLGPLAIALVALVDPLLVTLPVLLVFVLARQALPVEHPNRPVSPALAGTAVVLLLMSLALLPLVKATFAVEAALVLPVALLMLFRRRRWAAAAGLALFLTSLCLFWTLAGQPLDALPDYFRGLALVTSGYSEAMAWPGSSGEIIGFLGAALAIGGLALAGYRRRGGLESWLALAVLLAAFFIAFKAGFVRQDGHVTIAVDVLLLIGWLLVFELRHRAALVPLAIGTAACVVIGAHATRQPVLDRLSLIGQRLAAPADGLQRRLLEPGGLPQEFTRTLVSLEQRLPIPLVSGNVDIYSHDQVRVLAHDLPWNPRPMFQSATVYTEQLARMNVSHLEGPEAPETLLFAIEPIDARLAALEDGLSWPAILSRYAIVGQRGQHLALRKKPTAQIDEVTFGTPLIAADFTRGQTVVLPRTDGALWADLRIEPTLSGRLLALAYKPSRLALMFEMPDGS
jgi:hypothetical protein